MNDRLVVFVASSSEQIHTADKVADAIRAADQADDQPRLKVQTWREGVFNFSSVFIESLENELDVADFAVVILTGDDVAKKRKKEVNLPRDNVIFELGLFMGRLGRNRCFFFIDSESYTEINTDLSGVMSVKFYEETANQSAGRPSLKSQAQKVREQMVGIEERYKPSRETRVGQEELWRFCRLLSGYWWERMRKGEDDMSALSYVAINVDDVTNTPKLEGYSYDLDGELTAEWHSVVSGLELSSTKPTLSYRWEGEQEENRGQKYGGGGRITFDNRELQAGKGYFYDTNYALLKSDPKTRLKRFGFYRCEPDDVEKMRRPWTERAKALRLSRLTTLKAR